MLETNRCCRGKRWGVLMDLKAKTVHPEDVPLPALLLKLIARMQGQVGLTSRT